ncbi:MAG TPA: class II glutamine amidotransferase [Burkholderiales bacterium]|nr:class II glutamine amidotransferase [Burkholderiales bacterium]
MCRALLYLGEPVVLDNLLFQPDSALVRQSYMPKMLHMLNLAGFGLRAWDPGSHAPHKPFAYGSPSLPVFDRNLKNLAEKIRAACVLGHVRGVAYSTAVEISLQNVHPFQFEGLPWALAHNGDLAGFARMKPLLAPHVRPEFLAQIRGTTDSEWLYALFVSQLADPAHAAEEHEVFEALQRCLGLIRDARKQLGIDTSSSVNLFIANGSQLAAVRYCFDYGCYRTDDPAAVHEANLHYLSLWYTLGRDYALHDGEWKMTGGAEQATSIIVASEPLTRDTSSWVELPEYGALFAEVRNGAPLVSVRLLA